MRDNNELDSVLKTEYFNEDDLHRPEYEQWFFRAVSVFHFAAVIHIPSGAAVIPCWCVLLRCRACVLGVLDT